MYHKWRWRPWKSFRWSPSRYLILSLVLGFPYRPCPHWSLSIPKAKDAKRSGYFPPQTDSPLVWPFWLEGGRNLKHYAKLYMPCLRVSIEIREARSYLTSPAISSLFTKIFWLRFFQVYTITYRQKLSYIYPLFLCSWKFTAWCPWK